LNIPGGRYRPENLPSGIEWMHDDDAGKAWLEGLQARVDHCTGRWRLKLGPPFEYSYVSVVFPASTEDGAQVVLKLQFPHRESEHEAEALSHWDGRGAVRLLEHDPVRNALLLERCLPGLPLSSIRQPEAIDALAELLPRLWKPAGEPFGSLESEAHHWEQGLLDQGSAGGPVPEDLMQATLEALNILAGSQGEQVLLHQDLHGGNVLSAEREPWLVIDPKPLTGEREFGLAPIVRSSELGDKPQDVIYRLDTLTDRLGLDRERARLWAIAQTVAWSSGDHGKEHIATARLLLEA